MREGTHSSATSVIKSMLIIIYNKAPCLKRTFRKLANMMILHWRPSDIPASPSRNILERCQPPTYLQNVSRTDPFSIFSFLLINTTQQD